MGITIGISAILIPTCVVACGTQTNTSTPATSNGSNNNDNNNNVQNVANKLASFMNTNVPLSTFTNQQPISFNLANIPDWFNMTTTNKKILNDLIGSTSLSDIQVKVALPTYNLNPAPNDFTSNTNSIITVTMNGISKSSNLANFQTAQNYFQTAGIVSVTLNNPSQYSNITNLYKAIVKAGMSNANEKLNSNGSASNSASVLTFNQNIFQISVKNDNIFSWNIASLNDATCAIVDNTITLRINIQNNVWLDTNFTASDL